MDDNAEVVVLEVEDRSAQGTNAANQNLVSVEQTAQRVSQSINRATDAAGQTMVSLTDRSRNSIERIVSGVEQRVRNSTMSPLERLAADQTRDLGRVAGDPVAIQRVTSAYSKLTEAAREAAQEATGEKWRGFAESVRNFVENPLQAAQGAAIGLVEKLGPIGVIVGATVTAIGAVAFAGFEAAKSLGEYGTSVQNAAIRTGLSTKEVGQFGFAAKLAGQDISSVERMMRGLTMALEDNSSQGDKARAALQKLGVAPRDLEGNLRPTGQILIEISEGLNKLPSNFERNKVAMDIFKRAGIEALPVLLKFAEAVGRAQELNIGSSEATIAGYEGFHAKVVEMEEIFARLVRKLKEVIAVPVVFVLQGLLPGGTPNQESRRYLLESKEYSDAIREQMFKQAQGRDTKQFAMQAEKAEGAGGASILNQYLSSNTVENVSARTEKAKKDYEEARTQVQAIAQSQGTTTEYARKQVAHVEELRKNYEALHETQKLLEKNESDRLRNAEKLRDLSRQVALESQIPSYGELPADKKLREFAAGNQVTQAQVDKARQILAPERIREVQNILEKTRNQAIEASTKAAEATYGGSSASTPEQLSARLRSQTEAGVTAWKREMERQNRQDEEVSKTIHQTLTADVTSTLNQQVGQIRIGGILGDRTSQDRLNTEAALLQAHKDAADEQYRIDKEYTEARYSLEDGREERLTELRIKHAREVADIEISLAEKVAEEQRRQFDTIKHESESLLHTLFTDPSKFGAQFSRTIRDAFLKPVEEGLSTIIAQYLKPIIYGQNGEGGISGAMRSIFGLPKPGEHIVKMEQPGHLGDTLLTNGYVPVIVMNSGQVAQQTARSSAGGLSTGAGFGLGIGGGLGLLLGGGLARGGATAPGIVSSTIDFGEGALSTGAPAVFGGPEGIGSGAGGLGILPGEMGGMPTGMGGLGGFGGMFGGLGKLFGMGGGGGFNFGGLATAGGLGLLMSGMMSSNRNAMSSAQTIGGASLGLARLGIMGTQLGMVGGAGIGLAADGLRRGGFAGLGEDIGGGALVGMQFGGPVGALIGAGIGAGAGLLRMLIGGGMEDDVRKKVKSAYGVDISDQGILKQITNTIKQSFGGNVDVGIRSPQIRDLIQLYASASGQRFPTQAGARPLNLVESGGTLFQDASSYENGQAIGYSSSLPSYGGGFTVAPPAPGYGGSMVTTVGSYNAPVTSQSIHATVASAVNTAMAHLTVQMDPKATTAVFEGKIAGGIVRNGAAVTKAQSTELQANRSRRSLTASQLEPGTLIR